MAERIPIQMMSVVVILFSRKLSDFPFKDKSENTFIKICTPKAYRSRRHKVINLFANDNTLRGLVRRKYKKKAIFSVKPVCRKISQTPFSALYLLLDGMNFKNKRL